MERFFVENYGPNDEAVLNGISWLLQQGGGMIVSDRKSTMEETMESAFGTKMTVGEFKRCEEKFGRQNIRLSWNRRGSFSAKNVFALYPTSSLIEKLERNPSIESLFVLGYMEADLPEWRRKNSPTLVPGGREAPDWLKS